MRRPLSMIAVVAGMLLLFAPSAATAQSFGPTNCGHCPPDMYGGCILGCPIENPENCGVCWDGNQGTPCMIQTPCQTQVAILLDGTLQLVGDKTSIDSDVEEQEIQFNGHSLVYTRRKCDGAIVARTVAREFGDEQRRVTSILVI